MNPRHLYIHVPFCSRRCAYCDFSIAVRRETPVDEYLMGIRNELAATSSSNTPLETVYAGGGTPSRLGGAGIERMLAEVRSRFSLANDAEVTIEANPEDVTAESARAWKASGVNRISLGVQSFDDSILKWMHRVHDSRAATNAFQTLRDTGFDNISVDLIFALPDSLNRDWQQDLDGALALGPDHISLYGLTIEDHTPLSRWESRGEVIRAEDDRYAEEFVAAHDTVTAAGLDHYEVSNFGKPGRHSRHNSAYWTSNPYLGIGPSAHSFDGKRRWWNARSYAGWLDRVNQNESPVVESEQLTDENRAAERIYLALRTSCGLEAKPNELEAARKWKEAVWADIDGNTIRLTAEGWLRLDSLASQLTVI